MRRSRTLVAACAPAGGSPMFKLSQNHRHRDRWPRAGWPRHHQRQQHPVRNAGHVRRSTHRPRGMAGRSARPVCRGRGRSGSARPAHRLACPRVRGGREVRTARRNPCAHGCGERATGRPGSVMTSALPSFPELASRHPPDEFTGAPSRSPRVPSTGSRALHPFAASRLRGGERRLSHLPGGKATRRTGAPSENETMKTPKIRRTNDDGARDADDGFLQCFRSRSHFHRE